MRYLLCLGRLRLAHCCHPLASGDPLMAMIVPDHLASEKAKVIDIPYLHLSAGAVDAAL